MGQMNKPYTNNSINTLRNSRPKRNGFQNLFPA